MPIMLKYIFHKSIAQLHLQIQCNPCKMDTIGEMIYVRYMEVSLLKGFSKNFK